MTIEILVACSSIHCIMTHLFLGRLQQHSLHNDTSISFLMNVIIEEMSDILEVACVLFKWFNFESDMNPCLENEVYTLSSGHLPLS
jgi:hypothetical protein